MHRISLVLFALLTVTASAYAQSPTETPADWRGKETYGLGFWLAPYAGALFFDYNLNSSNQLHAQLGTNTVVQESIFGLALLETTRTLTGGSYRVFPWAENGFYFGAGGGVITTQLSYYGGYKASGSGLYAFGEAGWQGYDGYYFHLGFQPGINIAYSDDFDPTQIPEAYDHRSVAEQDWENGKNPTAVALGFGWFF